MRYYFVTFQTIHQGSHGGVRRSIYRSRRMYFVSLGNNYVGCEMMRDGAQNNAFGPGTETDIYFGSSHMCQRFQYQQSIDDAMALLQHDLERAGFTVSNLFATEMTPQQRQAFLSKDLFGYFDRCMSELYYCTSGRAERLITTLRHRIRERLFGLKEVNRNIVFHGRVVSASEHSYKAAKNAFFNLSDVVRETIKSGDTDALDTLFADGELDLSYVNQSEVFENIRSALDDNHNIDMGVQYCECGHFEYNDNVHDVRGDPWCDQCFDDNAVYVEDRDEYWNRDDACWSDNHDAYYSYDRDARDSEEEEDDEQDPDRLLDYSTNVMDFLSEDSKIKSSPHGEFLMGIEFEMETNGNTQRAVENVRAQLGDTYCVCKYDGSLGNGGLEIVTAPRGLTEHIGKFKAWDVHSDYRAWNSKRCGMHIHIDSHGFTQMTLGKFIMFINDSKNIDFVRKIAGRHPERDEQARSYAAAESQEVLVNPSKAVKGKSYERYRMVNLQNLTLRESKRLGFGTRFDEGRYDTVELRIFRASLKKERLLAQIEFTHAAIMFCRVASWRELNQATFLKWLKGSAMGLYPHLADWYGVRRRVPVCNEGKQAVCEDQPEAATEGD